MAKKRKLTLHVLFDTNIIFNTSATELLRKDVIDLIATHSSHSDIEIVWHIPEIVIKERTFQMNKEGEKLLPSIPKLEKILGSTLNINQGVICNGIDLLVKKQIDSNKLQVIKIDTAKVDWESIIHKAAYRHPPFEDGEKEKGFRDAIILENLKALIKKSSKTKSICRIILITNDGLLYEAAQRVAKESANVHIFRQNDELISLINVLSSEITEKEINSISVLAEHVFLTIDDKKTLFYTQKIQEKILEKYSTELNDKIDGADTRKNGAWTIHSPGFEKKKKQRVFWKTKIEIDFELFKSVQETSSYAIQPSVGSGGPLYTFGGQTSVNMSTLLFNQLAMNNPNPYGYTIPTAFPTYRRDKIGDGKTTFEVIWSVTLTQKKKLINQKIESIKYIDTIKS